MDLDSDFYMMDLQRLCLKWILGAGVACSLLLKIDAQLTNLGALIDNDLLLNNDTQHYSIPLIGCLNTSKLIPGFITDIKIDLTLNNITNFILAATATANSFVTGYTIKMLN